MKYGLSRLKLKEIKKRLEYRPDTGEFRWLNNYGSRAKAGAIAGNVNKVTGYRIIHINKKQYLAHRLAFLFMTGNLPFNHVDHINGFRDDNRWENLRDVSMHENLKNQRLAKSNSSGITGVYWNKQSKKWAAQIKHNYRTIHLGMYDDIGDAKKAREDANKRYAFHHNHGFDIAK